MKINRKWLIAAVVTAFLLSGCSEGSREMTEESSAAGTGSPAGQITFETVDLEGNKVSGAVFTKSKLTMVNVWATYCNPCLSEMPDLGELAGAYSPEEFQVVGIVSDVQEGDAPDSVGLAADLVGQTGADYTHLLLNESVYNALLTDVTAVPTTFFVDDSGEVLDIVVGAMEKSAWEEKINEFLEG